ncbi:MAE_28990/MAE_18760 family HEPN-like nuclease [Comamonas sp. NLF-1-9]|uniref:MAE_28990/MAE_18760 family HEPN-like nuclease n=1 Tax=Comamonas sp. NLF-1-9 TaxID=2853163 RepID=UPI001C47FF0D|nr:MAE_28990/MAE_18760 family HEPN-like nuclease [Comamonas sp. NLF-1-9]QXL84494.1 hypothetical protein KUD94_00390 [Comamonas sp. NLF-1-9]
MSKARTESDLSAQLDADFTSRLRELSDLKRTIRDADPNAQQVLLKALVTISYAHWEGHVKFAASKYFEYVALRRLTYISLQQQFYVNSFLVRLGAFVANRPSLKTRCDLISEALNPGNACFSQVHPELVNTGSNLKFEILQNICLVCGIDCAIFQPYETFIDLVLLRRRNSIAHGDESVVDVHEVDELIDGVVELMRLFRNQVENKVYTQAYLASSRGR